MRQFTTSNSFHDNEGNLLVGRITFYKKGTEEKCDIMNSSGWAIMNPQFTNQIGQTAQQVFLPDEDVFIKFEKYIGNGNMETDVDESHWLFQYSCVDLYDTFSIKVETEGLQTIPSISSLRNTNPSIVAEESGEKIILLTGYNKAGDKPMIQYIWDEDNTEADNGGSVIQYDEVSPGRWVFLPDQYDMIDVRHFGALPCESIADVTEAQSYAIQAANTYAALKNDPLYFPAGIYRIHSNVSNCVFDEDSKVCIPSGYNVSIKCIDKSYNFTLVQSANYYGYCNVEGPYLHYDCVKGLLGSSKDYEKITFNPTERFDLDANVVRPLTIKDVELYIKNGVTYSGGKANLVFENCNIHSNKAITNNLQCTLKRIVIKQDMFADDLNFNNISLVDCYVSLSNFTDVMFYVKFKNAMNDPNYGDMNGMTLDDSVALLNNAYLYNARGSVSVGIANTISFENSNVSLSDHCYKLNAKDSSITLPYAAYYECRNSSIIETANGACNTCSMNNCNYEIYGNKSFTDLHLYECKVTENGTETIQLLGSPSEIDSCVFPKNTKIIATQTPTIVNSRFGTIECKQNCKPIISNNYIYGDVLLYIYDQMEFTITNNSFEGHIEFENPNEIIGVIVKDAKIISNKLLSEGTLVIWDKNAIDLDPDEDEGSNSWFDDDDTKHNYIYQNNSEFDFRTSTTTFTVVKYKEDNTPTPETENIFAYWPTIDSGRSAGHPNSWGYGITSDWNWGTEQKVNGFIFSFGKNCSQETEFEIYFCDKGEEYVIPKAFSGIYSHENPPVLHDNNGFYKDIIDKHIQTQLTQVGAIGYNNHAAVEKVSYRTTNKGTSYIDNNGRKVLSIIPNCSITNTNADYGLTKTSYYWDDLESSDNNKKIEYKVITKYHW